jgi:hypothetical protein
MIDRIRRCLPDLIAVAALAGGFFAINDVATWIGAPYWQDEAWVAVSTRVPLSDLPHVTSVTPIGWSLLLRLIPDPDQLRLLPLVFALAAVVAAYTLGRLVGWRGRAESVFTGLACGAAVVLLPAQQLRHDLKHYTADAAVTLAILAGVAWLDQGWSRRRLTVLAAGAPAAFLVSHVALIGAATTFVGLLVTTAVGRQARRLVELVTAGAASGFVLLAMFLILVRPHHVPALADFWHPYFPTVGELPRYLLTRLWWLRPTLGLPNLSVVLALAGAGLVVLTMWRRLTTALTIALIPVAMVALGVAQLYPLLDLRTSYFLFESWAATAAVAVAGGAIGLARLLARGLAQIQRTTCAALAIVLALGAFAGYNRVGWRFDGADPRVPFSTQISLMDIRTQVRWVGAHRAPGDLIVIPSRARYGYSFYHDRKRIAWIPAVNPTGWNPEISDSQVIVAAPGTAAIARAIAEAAAQAQRNGPRARVLFICSGYGGREMGAEAWRRILAPYTVSHPYAGVEPVTVLTPPWPAQSRKPSAASDDPRPCQPDVPSASGAR